eukprot:664513_1
MADEWKCLFCNVLNETDTTTCPQCTKANPAVVNINQICFCGQKLIENSWGWDKCMCCCRVLNNQETHYVCKANPCTFKEMTGYHFFSVCGKCTESINITRVDSKHSFVFCKMVSLMTQIKKETKGLKDNDERRRYMFWVYFILYNQVIGILSGSMNESERKEIQDMFDAFYGGVMDEIKQNIDSKELALASHIFV